MHIKPNLKRLKAGFTLIELLVVIAIIGILASVVLASLNTARAKAADTSIKEDLMGVRTQAEIFYDDTNQSYGADVIDGDCTTVGSVFTETHITNALLHAENVSGVGVVASCYSDDGDDGATGTMASSWAISIPLKTDPLQSWCVTNGGIAALGTAQIDPSTDLAVCL